MAKKPVKKAPKLTVVKKTERSVEEKLERALVLMRNLCVAAETADQNGLVQTAGAVRAILDTNCER